MKRILLLLCIPVLISMAAAQRLPETAIPDNYKLTFTPDFSRDTFAGEETISVRVPEPTAQIVLNAAQIDFQDVTITSGNGAQQAAVKLDEKNETATLTVARAIPAGAATIQVRYTGILNNELRGFYLGKDQQGRKYAATQFEATDARRAFPSFDEPAYKATFDITVVADKGMAVISNSRVVSDAPSADGAKRTVRFATTPKMSSYLVAMVVGNFEYIEGSADGIPIRVYTSPGKKQLGAFALDAAENIMRYYNRYFGIKYPYGKLDLVGLADFSAGAMENTGCITFRELLLLADEKNSSLDLRKTIASVLAHEMAHQWFGDLVTMQWWDDTWLNEGFATWMSSKPVAAWKPEWNVQLDDVHDATAAMGEDSLNNTHPIHQNAQTPGEILELADTITYSKTAAVLRMLETYLGPDTFRAGVNAYLKEHAYANATAADFWRAQTQASKKPVDQIMPTFVNQPGIPMVSITTRCSGKSQTATIEQRRYFIDRSKLEAGNSEIWQIPVCMKQSGSAPQQGATCALLTQKQQNPSLKGCSSWVYGNAGAKGYYYSVYEPQTMRALARDEQTALSPAEQMVLLSDASAAVRVDRAKIGDYLEIAQGLQGERTPAVLDLLVEHLTHIGDYLVSDADRGSYEQWVRQLLNPAAKAVGWEPKPGETGDVKSVRVRLLFGLGYTARDPQAVAMAHKLAEQALENPASVDHDLAAVALRIAARDGDETFYNTVLDHVKNARSPEETYIYRRLLTEFTDPRLVQRTLEFAMSPEVRSQDSPYMLGQLVKRPATSRQAWDFVRAHWAEIDKLGGAFAGGAIVNATGSFCDAQMGNEVKEFFAAHSTPSAERTLKQSLEQIGYCVDMKERQSPQLATWLGAQPDSGQSTSEGTGAR